MRYRRSKSLETASELPFSKHHPLDEAPRSLEKTGLSSTETISLLNLIREIKHSERFVLSDGQERFIFSSYSLLCSKSALLSSRIDRVDDKKKARLIARHAAIRLFSESVREAIVKANQGFVISIARSASQRFSGKYGVLTDDLVQEGNLGLMRAIDKFDLSYGNRFLTYGSWHIRASILRYVFPKCGVINETSQFSILRPEFDRFIEEHRMSKGHYPSAEKVSEVLEISIESAKLLLAGPKRVPLRDQEGELTNDMDMLASANTETPESLFQSIQTSALVTRLLERLPLEMSSVVKGLYGIGREPVSSKRLADELGIKKSKVNALEHRAFQILRGMSLEKGTEFAGESKADTVS